MIDRIRDSAEWLEQPVIRRLVIGLFIAIAAVFTLLPFVRFLQRGTEFDYRTWFDAGQAVLHGRLIYPPGDIFPFMYPPSCALLLAAPAFFGKAAMILLLCALNTVAWILCIKFSLMLTKAVRFGTVSAFFPSFTLLVFIWSNYHLGQPSLILLALMLGAFVCLQRNNQILSGSLIALAAAIKAFPFLAIIYLVYRRYWIAAISMLIALLSLLFILPIPVRGVEQTLTDFREWQSGMLRYNREGIAQRATRGYSWKNQSAFGLANRMLRSVSANDEEGPVRYINFCDLDFRAVNVVILILALLVGVLFIASMPRLRGRGEVEELGAVLMLMLLFTPLAFGYLFSWLMMPLAILAKQVLTTSSSVALWFAVFALALLTLTALAPHTLQSYGSLFIAALTVYLALCVESWRRRRGLIAR